MRRAALEAVAYQTRDLLDAMAADRPCPSAMRIDGGMTANAWLCQFLADVVDLPVERTQNLETTALGAAFLAGLATGVWNSLEEVAETWRRPDCFSPRMASKQRDQLIAGWRTAVASTLARS